MPTDASSSPKPRATSPCSVSNPPTHKTPTFLNKINARKERRAAKRESNQPMPRIEPAHESTRRNTNRISTHKSHPLLPSCFPYSNLIHPQLITYPIRAHPWLTHSPFHIPNYQLHPSITPYRLSDLCVSSHFILIHHSQINHSLFLCELSALCGSSHLIPASPCLQTSIGSFDVQRSMFDV